MFISTTAVIVLVQRLIHVCVDKSYEMKLWVTGKAIDEGGKVDEEEEEKKKNDGQTYNGVKLFMWSSVSSGQPFKRCETCETTQRVLLNALILLI